LTNNLDEKLIPQQAERILRENNVTSLPVDLSIIYNKAGIVVSSKEGLSPGVSGMLIRSGNNFGIIYSCFYHNTGFERFSIAHELGHYFIEGHVNQLFLTDAMHISHAGCFTEAENDIERQADIFATNLLMPESLIHDEIATSHPSIESIKKLSEKCQTSFTATTIRYIELTKHAVCLIVSDGDKICYSFMSDNMKKRKLEYIRKNTKIIPKTVTYTAIHDGTLDKTNYVSQDAYLYDWFDCNSKKWTTEEVLKLPSYNKIITLIHF